MAYDFSQIYKNIKTTVQYNPNNKYTSVSGYITGQHLTDNFDTLATASVDLNDRLTTVENWPKDSESSTFGFITFNGREEKTGYFYGGYPLVLSGSTLSFPLQISVNQYFSVSAGNGIKYNSNGSINYTNTVVYEIDSGTGTFNNISSLITHLNNRLVNNGSGFYITGTLDLGGVSNWDEIFNWESNPTSFYVSVDDGTEKKINLTTRVYQYSSQGSPYGPNGVITVLNAALTAAGVYPAVYAELYTSGGTFVRLTGNSNRNQNGCSRFKIKKDASSSGGDILNQLGLLTGGATEKSVFDFSSVFYFRQHVTNSSALQIVGNQKYEKILLKDNTKDLTTSSLFNTLGFSYISASTPYLQYHTEPPKSTDNSILSFGGDLQSRNLYATESVRSKVPTIRVKETLTENSTDILNVFDQIGNLYKDSDNNLIPDLSTLASLLKIDSETINVRNWLSVLTFIAQYTRNQHKKYTLTNVANNSTFTVPAGYRINYLYVKRNGGTDTNKFKLQVSSTDILGEITLASGSSYYPATFSFSYWSNSSDTTVTVVLNPTTGFTVDIIYELQKVN